MMNRLTALAVASSLALAGCGGDAGDTRETAKGEIDYDAPVAAAPVGADPIYAVRWESFAKGEKMTDGCKLAGTLTNNSKDPLSFAVVTYQPIFTPEASEYITYRSYYDMNVSFGQNMAGRSGGDLDILAPGDSAPIMGVAQFGCEEVSELKLRYFNCAGVKADGTQQGRRCGTESLEIDNAVGAPVTR